MAFHRDPRFRNRMVQGAVLAIVCWCLATLFLNTVANLESRGIRTGFDFLGQVAPFRIDFTGLLSFTLGDSTYWRVFAIGIQNTLLISALGIAGATILGLVVGIARLSPNWFISCFALAYIECLRNVPLLLQIMFWHFAVFLPALPPPQRSLSFDDIAYLNNRGLYLPRLLVEYPERLAVIWTLAAGALAMAVFLARRGRARQSRLMPRGFVAVVTLGAVALLGTAAVLLAGQIATVQLPVSAIFNIHDGVEVPLALCSLWFSLTTYTAAFIAENVRGGISAVSASQTEAAQSLGLTRWQTLRLVVLPQALRVAVPPTISQYLNLAKNSSLAVAIGYEDLANIWAGIALNQTGQALIIIAMTMLVYQCISLCISFLMNVYNARTQLVER